MPSQKYDIPKLKERLLNDQSITEENRYEILHHDNLVAMESISIGRRTKYFNTLIKIGRQFTFKLSKPTLDDITAFVEWVDGTSLAPNTKNDYKKVYKTFVKRMNRGRLPKALQNLNIKKVRDKEILEGQLLTEEDISTLVNGCDNARDKLIISLLWETGARIDEIMTTNIEDVEDDVNGMRIRISGKTGPRKILIIESIPYLTAWLSNHPDRNNGKAPLLTNFGTRGTGKRMEYFSIRKMLNGLKKQTGLKKKVNPHHFRHSRGTWLASRMPESPLKRYLGWTPDSKQLAVYIHLSGRDVDDAVLKLHDIPNQKSLQSTRTPTDCPRCGSKNPPDASFCSKCSLNLQINYEEKLVEDEERKSFDARMDEMEQRMLRLLFKANKKWYDELGLDFESFCDDYYWKQEDIKKGVNKGRRYMSDGPFDILAED